MFDISAYYKPYFFSHRTYYALSKSKNYEKSHGRYPNLYSVYFVGACSTVVMYSIQYLYYFA